MLINPQPTPMEFFCWCKLQKTPSLHILAKLIPTTCYTIGTVPSKDPFGHEKNSSLLFEPSIGGIE